MTKETEMEKCIPNLHGCTLYRMKDDRLPLFLAVPHMSIPVSQSLGKTPWPKRCPAVQCQSTISNIAAWSRQYRQRIKHDPERYRHYRLKQKERYERYVTRKRQRMQKWELEGWWAKLQWCSVTWCRNYYATFVSPVDRNWQMWPLGRGISVGHFNYIPLYGNVSTVLMYDLVGFTISFSTTIAVLHTLSPPLFSKLQKLTAQLTRFIVILQLYMKFASIRNRTPSNVVLGEGDINTGFASCLFVHQTFVQTVKSQLSTYHWAFCNQTWYDCALPRAGFFQ